MAWTRKLKSGKYSARYRGADGESHPVPGGPWTHKREAEREAGAAEVASRALGWRDPKAAGRPWGEWCAQWWPSRGVAASTDRNDVGRRNNHLMPRWGDVALVDITRHDVKEWAAELRDGEDDEGGLAAGTVIQIVGLLSRSLRAAVDAEVLPYNVADKLKLPAASPGKERFLTREQVAKILGQLDGRHLAMAKLLVGTGMRWGEAAALHRDRIHPERRLVDVVEAFDSTTWRMSPLPKDKQIRTVPVPAWIDLSTLEDQADEDGEDGDGTCGYTHTEGHCPGPLLLTGDRGKIMGYRNFQNVFKFAVRRARVGHVRIHDLRHTYASWLLQGGRTIAEVGELLGHASPLTTQRYARLDVIASEDVLDALGSDPSIPPPSAATKPADELAARRARRAASA
ncbi:Site-specific recombinase XerD [Promicromonospora umidemergens]|uniref:Site-specific recombinase XerD n=1 Tax=Promicromonospora umidemergens TaxID=629679 RepID=A0ABP8XFP0_9MICO|nr:site-specific integrase [Promicromonospora umidemergens]MCP2284846.1 Site-specific recombinase XerD [Promicromonospora umidemergens]